MSKTLSVTPKTTAFHQSMVDQIKGRYERGLESLVEEGHLKMSVVDDRILVYNMYTTDLSSFSISSNAKLESMYLVSIVLAVGPDVKRVKVGDHLIHISTAHDGMTADSPRHRFIRETHVLGFWDPDTMTKAEMPELPLAPAALLDVIR